MAPRRSSRIVDSDSEGDDGGDGPVSTAPVQPEKGWLALSETEQNEYAATIVRHALARQATKSVFRRNELTKAMFPPGSAVKSRQSIFSGAFKLAQSHLQNVYSVEMLEVVKQLKSGRGAIATQALKATATQTAADGAHTQVSGGGAKAYILVSTMPQSLRPKTSEEWAVRSFLAIIASIIMLKPDCRVEEKELEQALLRACGVRVQEAKGHRQLNGGNVKELLQNTFVKQWYLEREKEDREYYYIIGPRLRAEFDDDSMIQFVTAVYNLGADQQNEMDATTKKELQQRLDAARGIQLVGDVDDDSDT
jgi:ribosomal protein L12E/L44/L45/RPP1/RPP2